MVFGDLGSPANLKNCTPTSWRAKCCHHLPDHTRDPPGGCQPPSIHCAGHGCSSCQGAAMDVWDQWQEAADQLQAHKDTQQVTASIISD